MRISCSSLFLWDYGIEEIIDILAQSGIESIEFWAETPKFWVQRHDPGAVAHHKDVISILTDQCTVHAPIMDLNPSSYNEHVRKAAMDETIWAIDLCNELDASILTIHPGNRTVHRSPTPEDWERFHHYLTICIHHARNAGIILALENPTQRIQSMCSEPAEMRNVLIRYPDLMMTLDIPHAIQTGMDNAVEFVDDMKDRIVNVHVGGVHDDVPHYPGHLGQNPRTTAILGRLCTNGYDNDLTIEIDDKLLDECRSKSDKVSVLINEKEYLTRSFIV